MVVERLPRAALEKLNVEGNTLVLLLEWRESVNSVFTARYYLNIKFACLNQCCSICIKQKLAEESFSSGIKFDLLPEFLFDIDEDSLQLEQNTKSLGTPICPGLSACDKI